MLVDELRELTNNSKQYQKEYEEIVRKLKGAALTGLNELKLMGGISDEVKDKLEDEGLTVGRYRLSFTQPIEYTIISW